MLTRVITLLLTGVVAVCTTLPAQNFSINYQTPDQLAVCANDTLFVTIQNNTASTVSGALLDLELPSGLEYLPGSLSGATESNISNLQKPILALPALPPGQALSLRLQLAAGCGLVDAINSSQLFSLLLRVRAGATTEAITTAAFQVQTSLLVITEVENDSVSGVYGDMWIRTIHVQNTRLGPVRHLFLSDQFPDGGFSVQVAGAASEQSQAVSYDGRFDGSFFTAFGDGDTLLEFGETVLLREKITITNCGKVMKTSRSDISVGWSCSPDAPVCQIDSAVADVVILEYKNGPEVAALGDYPLAWDYCAETPAKGTIKLTNYGGKTAQNIFTEINTNPPSPNMGIDPNSLRLWYHGVLTPIPASLMDTLHLPACGKTYASSVSFYVPEIAGHDSAFVYYDAYYCLPGACEQDAPVLDLNFFQFADCVSQTSASLVVQRQADDLLADVYFDIGNCLQDGAVYDFKYVLQCERLLGDSGYIWLKLDLPYGLFWSPTCAPVLGGKSPASFSIDSVNTGTPVQRVLLAFELPLNSATVDMPFCLRSTCRDDAAYVPHTGIDGPDAAGTFVLYPSNGADSCGNCGYLVHTAALLTPRLDSDLACAIPNCDTFRLRTECDRMDCGGTGVAPSEPCPALREHFKAARTNYGLADNDNNRIVDPAGALDLAKIRRDRFIAGDTLQAVLSTKILCGDSLTAFFYQIFTETIQSDIDYAGVNDNFELGPKLTNTARQHLANRDSFQVIGATFMVWDSSANAVYACPVLPGAGGTNTHFGLITPVNTKPPPAKDQLATMSYIFEPNLSALGAAGCLPAGLMLESGDSVALVVDYKLAFNFVPYSAQHQPPLINFEMSFNTNGPEQVYSYRQFDTLMFQYSGVRDSVSHPQFGIKACANSQEIKPFSYTVRLARENLFPYEVRPLNTISDYKLSLPAGLQVNGVTLEFMNLQENYPLLQNLPLPFANSGAALDIDFAGLYQSPPDEGYYLRTHVEFAPNCQFSKPQASNQRVALDWVGCIEMPDPDTIKTGNVVGFLANLPRDTMTTDETEIEFPTPQVAADVFLENKAPIAAPNFWIQFINPGGGLSDFSVVPLSPGGPALTPLNGIVQLGELAPSGLKSLRIQALNNTCVPQELWLLYGWDCQPHTQPGQASCSVDTLKLQFIPQNPEIELELLELPDQVPLCDSSEYLVLEISNAELGYAFQPSATLELPAGFQLVPGSCQLAYPKGAAFVNISDPAILAGGIRQWDIAQLQATIGATGLPGVNLKPANTLQIRFRLRADCGVVSNAQLVFGARAEWFCGLEANSLRKASAPLPVEGITPTYNAQVTVSELGGGGLSPCGTEHTMAVSIQVSGPALPGDSIYVSLPQGAFYTTGSYQPGPNAPGAAPDVSNAGLRWPMPAGLAPNAVLSFTFQFTSSEAPSCSGSVLRVQTRQQSQAYCPAISADCKIYVVGGEQQYFFPAPSGNLLLSGVTLQLSPDGKANYLVSVANLNTEPKTIEVLQFFYDTNHDGQYTEGVDALLYTVGNLNAQIAGGDTLPIALNGLLAPDSLCNLLVVLPTIGNCLCPVQALPITSVRLEQATLLLCPGQSAGLGVSGAAGHSYAWSGVPDLPCTDCPQFQYLPAGPGLYELNLHDETTGCSVDYAYHLDVQAAPVLLPGPAPVCRGQLVTLQTTAAVSWQWQGPGITAPGAAMQSFPAQQTATYFVTATNAAGCTGTGSATVAVLPADTVDLGTIRTCESTPVEIFGQSASTPGLYTQTVPNSAGCDSLTFVLLDVVPNTEEPLARCKGDTVQVFGQPVTATGTFCDTFPSSLGCDSIHCVVISEIPQPVLPEPDTFYIEQGGSVLLPGPAGYVQYLWTPADSLSCTSCQSPLASPSDTTDYTVHLTTADGCRDTLVYRVAPFPPCDPKQLKIPNVFTPDNDGLNDVFAVVPYEGSEIIERLTIYNRWGQKLYESSGPNAAWDGTSKGKPVPSDVYVWLLEIRCAGGEKGVQKGDVTVLR